MKRDKESYRMTETISDWEPAHEMDEDFNLRVKHDPLLLGKRPRKKKFIQGYGRTKRRGRIV